MLIRSLATGFTAAWLLCPATADTVTPAGARYGGETAHPRSLAAEPTVARTASVRPVANAAASCASTGDRMMRIAKPGLLGGLIGAGLGAAGGAIANGGKAAGKGALLGGLAGAALGGGDGAYKTKNECGTVFGGSGFSGNGVAAPTPAVDRGIACTSSPSRTLEGTSRTCEGIMVYNAGSTLPREFSSAGVLGGARERPSE